MTYRGRVKNGVVVLDEPAGLADGQEVSVRPLKRGQPRHADKKPASSLYTRLKPFFGMADGLPSDMAENHDHYLYGVKKER